VGTRKHVCSPGTALSRVSAFLETHWDKAGNVNGIGNCFTKSQVLG
jgi:hypothetical protein